jgi:Cu+-exporting ATPase
MMVGIGIFPNSMERLNAQIAILMATPVYLDVIADGVIENIHMEDMGIQTSILWGDAEAVEYMRKVDTLVVDKTGTLTGGKPKVTRVEPFGSIDEKRILAYAANLEQGCFIPFLEYF